MLLGHHYQNAYICKDINAGIDLFRERGLAKEPHIIEVDQPVNTPDGEFVNSVKLCFIWIGEMQYELIEVKADPLGIYGNYQPNGGVLNFHHVCMRVPDWQTFRAAVEQQNLPLAMERDFGGDQLKFLYLDARKVFGHYLEYTWMTDAAWDQIRGM